MKKIYVAGHNGMVGSAIIRLLKRNENVELITTSRDELDLTDQTAVNLFFQQHSIDEVYLAAAKVGGIYANMTYPGSFIYENLAVQNNVIHAAYKSKVSKLMFLGSSCIYPKNTPQPMKEDALLTGLLEPTNEPYAVAKIAGIKLCESYNREYGTDFRAVMPTNLYGPNDNFHPQNSHVLPALLRRFCEAVATNADSVSVWGTGNVKREFMHVDDMASACVHLMGIDTGDFYRDGFVNAHVNIGTGVDCTIKELVEQISNVTGYNGIINWDITKPEGTQRKLLNTTKLESFGWKSGISLVKGLEQTYQWFVSEYFDSLNKPTQKP